MKLRISAGAASFEVLLKDTPTAQALLAALPFESRARTWGEEVYFTTPVSAKLEADAKQIVEPGTVCFWTEGNALALPTGRTPISTDERPKGEPQRESLLEHGRFGSRDTASITELLWRM